MTRLLLWNLALALMWALGTATFSPLNLLAGWVLGTLLLRYLRPMPEAVDYTRRLRLILVFALRYAWNVLRSSVQVARLVLAPSGLRPGFVRVPLEARGDAELLLLSNLISFAPGTLCVDFDEDRSHLLIHALDVADEQALVDFVKRGLEEPILRILR